MLHPELVDRLRLQLPSNPIVTAAHDDLQPAGPRSVQELAAVLAQKQLGTTALFVLKPTRIKTSGEGTIPTVSLGKGDKGSGRRETNCGNRRPAPTNGSGRGGGATVLGSSGSFAASWPTSVKRGATDLLLRKRECRLVKAILDPNAIAQRSRAQSRPSYQGGVRTRGLRGR